MNWNKLVARKGRSLRVRYCIGIRVGNDLKSFDKSRRRGKRRRIDCTIVCDFRSKPSKAINGTRRWRIQRVNSTSLFLLEENLIFRSHACLS